MIEKIDLSDYEELDDYINTIASSLKDDELYEAELYEIMRFIPDLNEEKIGFVCAENIRVLAAGLEQYDLLSEPRIHLGYVPRRLDSLIVIFRNNECINYSSNNYKCGSLVARIMVLMANADGHIDDIEKKNIKAQIQDLNYLNTTEKNSINAKVICFIKEAKLLNINYYDFTLNKLVDFGSETQHKIIDLIKQVAVSDGYIDNTEVKLLRDIYKKLDLPTYNIKNDLKFYAKSKHIMLREYKDAEINKIIDEDIDISEIDYDIEKILSDMEDN